MSDAPWRRFFRLADAGVLLCWLVAGGPAVAECDPQICSGSPSCTISGTHLLDDGCILDFGSRAVTLAGGATLNAAVAGIALRDGRLTASRGWPSPSIPMAGSRLSGADGVLARRRGSPGNDSKGLHVKVAFPLQSPNGFSAGGHCGLDASRVPASYRTGPRISVPGLCSNPLVW